MHQSPRVSRREALKNKGQEPVLPEVESSEYLIGYLFEVGPALPGPSGAVPLTHEEIRHWRDVTYTPLNRWEARALHRLSRDYVSEFHQAADPARPSPYEQDEVAVDLHAVANSMRSAMRKLSEL